MEDMVVNGLDRQTVDFISAKVQGFPKNTPAFLNWKYSWFTDDKKGKIIEKNILEIGRLLWETLYLQKERAGNQSVMNILRILKINKKKRKGYLKNIKIYYYFC